jgi:SAM-dependent methyltransferase
LSVWRRGHPDQLTYLDSHKAPGKGRSYDRDYSTDPLLRYLWQEEQAVLDRILADYYASTPVDLLDFACGTGRVAGALEDRVRSATGIDVSESMLEVARAKLHRTELINANLLDECVLEGREFNLITAFRFFANAERELRRGALRALEPLLTEDGYFVFNNHQNLGAMYSRLAQAHHRLRHRRPYVTLSLGECEKLLAEVGLEIERIYPLGLLHLPRVRLPHALYRRADRLASTSDLLAARTESPIIVAQRH